MPAAPVCLLKNWPKQLLHFWPSGAAGTGWVVYTTRLNISHLTVTERGGRPGPAATLWVAVMCEEPACWSSLRGDLLISSWCYAAGRARPVVSCVFGYFFSRRVQAAVAGLRSSSDQREWIRKAWLVCSLLQTCWKWHWNVGAGLLL